MMLHFRGVESAAATKLAWVVEAVALVVLILVAAAGAVGAAPDIGGDAGAAGGDAPAPDAGADAGGESPLLAAPPGSRNAPRLAALRVSLLSKEKRY